MTRNDKLGKVIENIDFLSINNLFGKPSTKCLTSCTVWKDVGRSVTHLPDDEVYLIVTLILQILEYVRCKAASTDYFVPPSVRLHLCSPLIVNCFSEYRKSKNRIWNPETLHDFMIFPDVYGEPLRSSDRRSSRYVHN